MNLDQPTIKAVAERAKVSISSVSRALNRPQSCGPAILARVERAAAELGYVPNHAARSLKAQRTEQIAFAVADIANPVYLKMVRSIQSTARASGYRLLLLSTDAHPDEELKILRSLRHRFADGLIICPIRVTEGHVYELARVATPTVVIGPLPSGVVVDNVVVDDSVEGVRLAIDHLVGLGRRQIALITGPSDTVPGSSRKEGYTRAIQRHGLTFDAGLVFEGDFRFEGGYQAADHILTLSTLPDGLFCANDLMAVGAMRRLQESGVRIPDDVAVVGMDDIDQATIVSPSLSSVSLRAEEQGRLAAEMLLQRLLDDTEATFKSASVEPQLKQRESTRWPGDG